MELAGGLHVRLSIIPAAAAPAHDHRQAGKNGEIWFKGLGATRARALPLMDRVSAENRRLAELLDESKLIYLLGGSPDFLAKTLMGSLCWNAVISAYGKGAVLAGSSAGAMVLCEHYVDPGENKLEPGLNLLPGVCVLPHHNTFGKGWARGLTRKYPQILFVGIDEETGIINDGPEGQWQIYGKGGAMIYRGGWSKGYTKGDFFDLSRQE